MFSFLISLPDALLEILLRLSMSLSLRGACGVVSGDEEASSLRFVTLS